MRRFLLILFYTTFSLSVLAVPAKHQKTILTLADGATVEAILCGDEFGHWYEDANGKSLSVRQDGIAYYLSATEFEELLHRTGSIQEGQTLRRSARRQSPQKAAYIGEKKGLVILVNFSDTNLSFNYDDFYSLLNQPGYDKNGSIGSASDYFRDQSYGKFNLTFDIAGPITLSKPMSYYGSNNKYGFDVHAGEMLIEACKAVDGQINFTDYDWDGDGEVDQVFVIYAGYSEAQGAASYTIWPHEWTLTSAKAYDDGNGAITLDGVTIDTYACSNELRGTSGTQLDGIGTICHEFSHCLGLPDIYNTKSSLSFSMNSWDIMSYGNYNCNGYVPAGYTSFERYSTGWLSLQDLTETATVNGMKALTDEGIAYRILNDATPSEMYILENRQQKSWDKGLGGHGMLVIHVDYNQQAWENNQVNIDKNHQRLDIIPADNALSKYSLSGDPFPGTKKVTSLTDETTPSAALFNPNLDGSYFMGKPITDITEEDGLISFNFMPQAAVPTILEATDITPTSFTANWENTGLADNFEIELAIDGDSQNIILSENFDTFTASTRTDITNKLDSYTQTTGWKGSKVHCANGMARIGVQKNAQGYILSPLVEAPESRNVDISFDAKRFEGEASRLLFTILDDNDIQQLDDETISLEKDLVKWTLSISELPDRFRVKMSSDRKSATSSNFYQFYLDNFAISDPQETLSNNKIFSDIASTRYIITGLEPSTQYKFRIRSYYLGKPSSWSEYAYVTTSENTLLGDVNNDGTITVSDLTELINYLLGTPSNYSNPKVADINLDGKIDKSDADALHLKLLNF